MAESSDEQPDSEGSRAIRGVTYGDAVEGGKIGKRGTDGEAQDAAGLLNAPGEATDATGLLNAIGEAADATVLVNATGDSIRPASSRPASSRNIGSGAILDLGTSVGPKVLALGVRGVDGTSVRLEAPPQASLSPLTAAGQVYG